MRFLPSLLLIFFASALWPYSALLQSNSTNASITLPDVELDSPYDNAATTSRNVDFSFHYYKRGTVAEESLCALYIDTVLAAQVKAKTGQATTISITGLERKEHKWQVFCHLSQSNLYTLNIIEPPPPKVTLSYPPNPFTTTNGSIRFSYHYSTGNDELNKTACSLVLSGIVEASSNISGDADSSFYLADIPPGTYSWMVQCDRPSFPMQKPPVQSEFRVLQVKALPIPKAPKKNQTNTSAPPPPPPKKFEISTPDEGNIGSFFELIVVDEDSKPVSGAEVIVIMPGKIGNLSLPKTDLLGRTSFTPNVSGTYHFTLKSGTLLSEYSAYISPEKKSQAAPFPSPKNSSPPSPPPNSSPPTRFPEEPAPRNATPPSPFPLPKECMLPSFLGLIALGFAFAK